MGLQNFWQKQREGMRSRRGRRRRRGYYYRVQSPDLEASGSSHSESVNAVVVARRTSVMLEHCPRSCLCRPRHMSRTSSSSCCCQSCSFFFFYSKALYAPRDCWRQVNALSELLLLALLILAPASTTPKPDSALWQTVEEAQEWARNTMPIHARHDGAEELSTKFLHLNLHAETMEERRRRRRRSCCCWSSNKLC
jgi:hypothetical protein